MGITMPGLSSNIDTKALISSLMQVESIPQMLIKNKVSDTQVKLSGLRELNTRVAALADQAGKWAKPDALALFATSVSSDSVTATAGAGASAGTTDVVVDKLAQPQSSVTAAMTGWSASTDLTITRADGTATQVTAKSDSLDDVVAAINDSGAGVSAMKVAAGTDAAGEKLYRLQVTAKETGAAGAFTLHAGTPAEVEAGEGFDVLGQPGAATIRTAQDAEVRLWAGTDAEQTITSATNTFTGLLPGVDVTVSKVSEDPVSVTVSADKDGVQKVAQDLVKQLAGIFSYIDVNSRTQFKTDADGSTKPALGVFTSDSTIRSVKDRLINAATAPVDGRSPSEIGVVITKEGTVEFDSARFSEAMAADPERVSGVLAELAGRIEGAAKAASDKTDGTLTSTIQSREREVTDFNDEIVDWDRRLALRHATLDKTWAALEVSLGALNAQGSWLSAQLSTLPSFAPKDQSGS